MKTSWKIWDKDSAYGELFYDRAVGKKEEMECSKSLCQIIKPLYKRGMKILDVGCGAGHYLRSLRSRIDPSIDYTGVDPTKGYIDWAEKAFPGTAFEVGDIYNLPFNKNSFDIVFSANVLLHLPPDLTRPFKELIRVTRHSLIIRTLFSDGIFIVKKVMDQKKKAKDLFDNQNEPKGFCYYNMYTEEYFRKLIKDIGGSLTISFIKDDIFGSFDNVAEGLGASKSVEEKQVFNNLLMDWRFIVIKKKR